MVAPRFSSWNLLGAWLKLIDVVRADPDCDFLESIASCS